MDFKEQGQAITNQTFLDRVAQAAVKTGLAVMAEAPETIGHTERAALAQRVFYSSEATAKTLARAVANHWGFGNGNAAEDPLVGDTPLEFQVAAIWDAFANVGGSGAAQGTLAANVAGEGEIAAVPSKSLAQRLGLKKT